MPLRLKSVSTQQLTTAQAPTGAGGLTGPYGPRFHLPGATGSTPRVFTSPLPFPTQQFFFNSRTGRLVPYNIVGSGPSGPEYTTGPQPKGGEIE